jgi:hypothetical protein
MTPAVDQIRKGEPFWGKKGAFYFMQENFPSTTQETNMNEHLAEIKGNSDNE